MANVRRLAGSRGARASLLTASKIALAGAVAWGLVATPVASAQQATGRSAADAPPPSWPKNPTAPQGAPNVLLILTDDVGFGASSTFGGPIPTPTFDALARDGLRYNRFNTTALCSPTRASLLTGRGPHNVGMGNVTNLPTGYDGYTSVIPPSAATVAEILKENGYNTAMFGKSHLTPEWEMSSVGPFDRWPTGLGFEHFYGFLSADSSMWAPSLVRDMTPIEPPHDDPNYHFDKDMADQAIRWMREQRELAPEKPFFAYYAPGTAHTPHHAPKEWLERFAGKFDQGWDKEREETFARQKKLGVIPRDAVLTPRPDGLPAWSSLDANQKRLYARLMEAYAASVAYMDSQVGRVIDELKQSGEYDNTLVIFIQGDNGGSAEGGMNGLLFEQSGIAGVTEDFDYMMSRIDEIGTPALYNHYPAAWGWAMNAPFPWYKQVASQAGGVRNGMVMSWPQRIRDKGGLRSQYAHVSDIMPTILEAAGVTAPSTVKGVPQQPIDGISLAYSFEQKDAASQRTTQVYEMMENFGVYHDGWMAGTLPKRYAWEVGVGENRQLGVDLNQRTWQLFHVDKDFSTARDLASAQPEKLKEMQALFWDLAEKNKLLPIHDWSEGVEGRPSVGGGRDRFVFQPGITRVAEDAAPHTMGRSFTIDADVVIPEGRANGVLITQGGRYGGYAFYLHEGVPVFHYNAVGQYQYRIAGSGPVQPGAHRLVARFTADEQKRGTAGTVTLLIDGQEVGRGRVDRTIAGWVSHTEGLDVGEDTLTPINEDYTVPGSKFSGNIKQIVFTLD